MSIDLSNETAITLAEARDHLPGRPHIATIWRWAMRGARGVLLETMCCGHKRWTTAEACERFIARSTAAAKQPSQPSAPGVLTADRKRQLAAADAILDAAGI